MLKRWHIWTLAGLLLAQPCLFAADEKPPTTAPAAISDGATLSLGDQRYVVKVVGGKGDQGAWPIFHTEDGQLAVWHDKKIMVYDTANAEPGEFACEWPAITLSASRRWAVVLSNPGHDGRQTIADLATNTLVVTLPENNWHDQWTVPPNGRIALPLTGTGQCVAADMATGKTIPVPFPASTVAGDTWSWSGFVMADGKNACLFLCSAAGRSLQTYRGTVPLDNPAAATFERSADDLASYIKHLDKDTILVREVLHPGQPRNLAVVSPKDWKVQRRVKDGTPEAEVLEGAVSPDGKWSYYCDHIKGLSIYDRATGKRVGHGPDRDGSSFNAASLGVTFNGDGTLAFVGTPYGGFLTVLRTKDHSLLGRFTIKGISPAGAVVLPPKKAGEPPVLLVVHTSLPYE